MRAAEIKHGGDTRELYLPREADLRPGDVLLPPLPEAPLIILKEGEAEAAGLKRLRALCRKADP